MHHRWLASLCLFSSGTALAAPAATAVDAAAERDAVSAAAWEVTAELGQFSYTPAGASVDQSSTSVNVNGRAQVSLMGMLTDHTSGTRLGDLFAFEGGFGGANTDGIAGHIDFHYRLEAGLQGVYDLSRDVELTARGTGYVSGDVARTNIQSSGAWAALQLAPGVRYKRLYVEGGPELDLGQSGTGFFVGGWYRFAPAAEHVRDLGFRVEHHASSGNNASSSDTLFTLSLGSH